MKIKFNDLVLGPVIGSGTVGAVYRAVLKPTGEIVAVKLLHVAVSHDTLVRARFRREIHILEKLRHPNIIRYLGDGEHDGQLFYVMEAVETGTVSGMLERFGAMSWKEAASIGRQVSSALQHAHNQGIIHRDLKPSNLFLTADGQIKLGDFGIAHDTHSANLTNEGITVGTHAYMSPEQITGGVITGKADLYSLGCVLFELLTGHKPFQGTNFAVLFEQHLRLEAPRVTQFTPECPKELADIIAKCLEKEPDMRPFNARAVQAVMLKLFDSQAALLGGSVPSDEADVPAASVYDPGMVSLAGKLTPVERQASWKALSILMLAAVLLILIAVFASK